MLKNLELKSFKRMRMVWRIEYATAERCRAAMAANARALSAVDE
jgi:hypothetical protein